MTIELPPQPTEEHFGSLECYQSAVSAWERVCKAIIAAWVAAQASPPTPDAMRDCLEWIASQTNLFFAECSQAEEIIHRVKVALASSLSDTGETPKS